MMGWPSSIERATIGSPVGLDFMASQLGTSTRQTRYHLEAVPSWNPPPNIHYENG